MMPLRITTSVNQLMTLHPSWRLTLETRAAQDVVVEDHEVAEEAVELLLQLLLLLLSPDHLANAGRTRYSYGAFPLHGMVQYSSHLRGFPQGYGTWYFFFVPPRPRFQASRTVTKTWRVNSADHWLAGENRHCLRHWSCDTRHNRPARFKSAQPTKDRTQLFWMSALF